MGDNDDASLEAAEEWDTHRGRQVSWLAGSGFLGRPRHLLE